MSNNAIRAPVCLHRSSASWSSVSWTPFFRVYFIVTKFLFWLCTLGIQALTDGYTTILIRFEGCFELGPAYLSPMGQSRHRINILWWHVSSRQTSHFLVHAEGFYSVIIPERAWPTGGSVSLSCACAAAVSPAPVEGQLLFLTVAINQGKLIYSSVINLQRTFSMRNFHAAP